MTNRSPYRALREVCDERAEAEAIVRAALEWFDSDYHGRDPEWVERGRRLLARVESQLAEGPWPWTPSRRGDQ